MNVCEPVAKIFKICHIPEEMDGVIIERDALLNEKMYESVCLVIPSLKSYLSSSYLTALQSNAKQQKCPLINILRQLLKVYRYNLSPKRLSNGYDKTGKKLYKRIFIIKKIENT